MRYIAFVVWVCASTQAFGANTFNPQASGDGSSIPVASANSSLTAANTIAAVAGAFGAIGIGFSAFDVSYLARNERAGARWSRANIAFSVATMALGATSIFLNVNLRGIAAVVDPQSEAPRFLSAAQVALGIGAAALVAGALNLTLGILAYKLPPESKADVSVGIAPLIIPTTAGVGAGLAVVVR